MHSTLISRMETEVRLIGGVLQNELQQLYAAVINPEMNPTDIISRMDQIASRLVNFMADHYIGVSDTDQNNLITVVGTDGNLANAVIGNPSIDAHGNLVVNADGMPVIHHDDNTGTKSVLTPHLL